MKKLELLNKQYGSEDLIDAIRDIEEAMDDDEIPKDKYGFNDGTYTVTMTWEEDE